MSIEELEANIKKIEEDYSEIINVTPETKKLQ